MTDEEIDAMEAGHETDALIAERVFGCTVLIGEDDWRYCGCPEIDGKPPHGDRKGRRHVVGEIKRYSTDIAAAWLVIEKLSAGDHIQIFRHGSLWKVYTLGVLVGADTAPLAICRAALKFTTNLPLPLKTHRRRKRDKSNSSNR